MNYMSANATVRRFRLNNLVVGAVGAAGSLNVDVAITSDPSLVNAVGFAVPIDADFTAGLDTPTARVTSATNLRLRFVNGSAAPIDPADTFDFDVYLFLPTGPAQQTI